MATRRVFVIWTHPLFHESVRLLLDHPDIEWAGATSNYENAQNEVLRQRPDTILVEEVGDAIPNKIVEILEVCLWNIRLVGLNLSNNTLSVYHHEQRTAGEAEDLLHLIQEDLTRGG